MMSFKDVVDEGHVSGIHGLRSTYGFADPYSSFTLKEDQSESALHRLPCFVYRLYKLNHALVSAAAKVDLPSANATSSPKILLVFIPRCSLTVVAGASSTQ